jgi:hypothetical protein
VNGSAAAAAAAALVQHQLPGVSSEALTFALLGAWGAAPKMTCLISTVGGAAAAAAAAACKAQEQQHGHQGSAGEGLPRAYLCCWQDWRLKACCHNALCYVIGVDAALVSSEAGDVAVPVLLHCSRLVCSPGYPWASE